MGWKLIALFLVLVMGRSVVDSDSYSSTGLVEPNWMEHSVFSNGPKHFRLRLSLEYAPQICLAGRAVLGTAALRTPGCAISTSKG